MLHDNQLWVPLQIRFSEEKSYYSKSQLGAWVTEVQRRWMILPEYSARTFLHKAFIRTFCHILGLQNPVTLKEQEKPEKLLLHFWFSQITHKETHFKLMF